MDTKNKCWSGAEGLIRKIINGLAKSKIKLDRKVLAELAYNNPEAFKSVVKKVQSSLVKGPLI